MPGAAPDAGDTESHGWSSAAVHDSDPLPPLVTDNDPAAGSVPPATPENERLAGATARAGPSSVAP